MSCNNTQHRELSENNARIAGGALLSCGVLMTRLWGDVGGGGVEMMGWGRVIVEVDEWRDSMETDLHSLTHVNL